MIRVIVSTAARGDFRQIVANLARDAGPAVAKRYAEKFDANLVLIAEHPEIGVLKPELGSRIRIRVIRPYVLIYSVAGETVEVLRFLHGKRKITRRMLRR